MLHIIVSALSLTCDHLKGIYQEGQCCDNTGAHVVPECANVAVDSLTLGTTGSKMDAATLISALGARRAVNRDGNFVKNDQSALETDSLVSSQCGIDPGTKDVLVSEYLKNTYGTTKITSNAFIGAVIDKARDATYDVLSFCSPTSVLTADSQLGSEFQYRYVGIELNADFKGTGYNSIAYFDSSNPLYSNVAGVAAGLSGDALDAANKVTIKQLYDIAVAHHGEFRIGLARAFSGSGSKKPFQELSELGIVNATNFSPLPEFANAKVYWHDGDHFMNGLDLASGGMDIAFTFVYTDAKSINEDGTFGATTALDGCGYSNCVFGWRDILPKSKLDALRPAAFAKTAVPNNPVLVKKGSVFDNEGMVNTLLDMYDFMGRYDKAVQAEFKGAGKAFGMAPATEETYAGWKLVSQSFDSAIAAITSEMRQVITVLPVEVGGQVTLQAFTSDVPASTTNAVGNLIGVVKYKYVATLSQLAKSANAYHSIDCSAPTYCSSGANLEEAIANLKTRFAGTYCGTISDWGVHDIGHPIKFLCTGTIDSN